MNKHVFNDDFKDIVDDILKENKTIEEWAEIESDDMFQQGSYVGGFDGIEMEFCFSFFEDDGQEYWFQLSLEDIVKCSKGEILSVEVMKPDY